MTRFARLHASAAASREHALTERRVAAEHAAGERRGQRRRGRRGRRGRGRVASAPGGRRPARRPTAGTEHARAPASASARGASVTTSRSRSEPGSSRRAPQPPSASTAHGRRSRAQRRLRHRPRRPCRSRSLSRARRPRPGRGVGDERLGARRYAATTSPGRHPRSSPRRRSGVVGGALERLGAALAGTDPDGAFAVVDEDLAVADLAGARRLDDGLLDLRRRDRRRRRPRSWSSGTKSTVYSLPR